MPAENRDRSQAVRELQIRAFWFAHGHNVTTTNVTRYRRLPKRCTFAAPSRPLSTLEPRKLAGEWRRQSDTQRRRSDTLARYTGTVQNCANVDGIRGVGGIGGTPKSVTCVFSTRQIGSTPPASTIICRFPICTVTRVTVQFSRDNELPPQGTQADVRKGPSSPH